MASEKSLTLEQQETLTQNAKVDVHKLGDVEGDPFSNHEYRKKEKKLVHKLDLTLMPMVWILYMFNYLDRNNIAYVFNALYVEKRLTNPQTSPSRRLGRRPRPGRKPVQCCSFYS